ncbi:hypothetical protein WMW72_11780 [Paenibacillus filicis]|uniref:Uncharacterized protein n=1 Tax=Paenibacillus filicis TaxID=669464 RepID=A0ABU9DI90_9BACL
MELTLAQTITALFEKLSPIEQKFILPALQGRFGASFQITYGHLSLLDHGDLQLIHSTIYGLILTREQLPEILERYKNSNKRDFV